MAAGSTAAVLYPVYRYLSPVSGTDKTARVVIPVAEVAPGEAKIFEFAGTAAVLVEAGAGQYLALSAVCTHLGCIVQWRKETRDFICPCHGGTYSAQGEVTGGPPPKPLQKLPLSVANGAITIG